MANEFIPTEFDKQLKRIYQMRQAKGLKNTVSVPNDATGRDLSRLKKFEQWLKDGEPVK